MEQRNEYIRVCRDERKRYEMSITEKCKNHPKLFYRLVSGKLKNKDGIDRLKVGEETRQRS